MSSQVEEKIRCAVEESALGKLKQARAWVPPQDASHQQDYNISPAGYAVWIRHI